MADGLQDRFDPMSTLQQAGVGAIVGAGMPGVSAALRPAAAAGPKVLSVARGTPPLEPARPASTPPAMLGTPNPTASPVNMPAAYGPGMGNVPGSAVTGTAKLDLEGARSSFVGERPTIEQQGVQASAAPPPFKPGQNGVPPDATGKTKLAEPVPDVKPSNKRHDAARATLKNRRVAKNTMIVPGTDIAPDIEAIRDGHAMRDGNYYVVNSRHYLMHEDTHTVFPVSGPGLVVVDQQGYVAIANYNKFGFTQRVEEIMDMAGMPQSVRQIARAALGQP